MKRLLRLPAAALLAAGFLTVVGCGSGERFAAVSGVVTVDGKPYEFCCPPCVDEFVKSAKATPDEIKPPAEYYKR